MPGRTLPSWYGLGGGEGPGNVYPEAPPYNRHHAASPFDQSHYTTSGYGYYNQGGSSTPGYSGPEQRPSPSYQHHYSPSPSPSYHYAEQAGTTNQQQQPPPSHMSFSSQQSGGPQAQGAYASNPSTGPPSASHYPSNHRHSGQHSYPSGSQQHQQWANYGSSSPVMGSPTSQRPPQSPQQNQFPQQANHWQTHGNNHSMVANMSPPPPSQSSVQSQYYQPPAPQAASPQQMDHQPVDLHSPGPSGPWSSRPPSGGTTTETGGGGGSPLASLQLLVNQDINRQAAAAAAYPPVSHDMVDLSVPRGDGKSEELRNGSTATSPPVLNGDLSSSADSGISSPMMSQSDNLTSHLQPPEGPRISVKSPQRLAAEAEARARRATPSPDNTNLEVSTAPREARTKASMKRNRKVDAILENLSGTKKKRPNSPPETPSRIETTPPPPSVVVIAPPSEDSSSCPNSSARLQGSPASREDTISPDDASQDKPRRKRKSDNPLRLKASEEAKSKSKLAKSESISEPEISPSKVSDESKSTEETKTSAVDLSVNSTTSENPETVSSQSPVSSPHKTQHVPVPPIADNNPSIHNSDQVENELAKMFEGIESESSKSNTVDDAINFVAQAFDTEIQDDLNSVTSTPSKSKRGRPKGSTPKKQKNVKKMSETPKKKRPDDEMYSPETSNKKKKKKSEGKLKGEEVKKNAQESVAAVDHRHRGPYVRIEGPRDSPINVTVYNSTRGDADEDGDRPAAGALKHGRKKMSWHNERELRHRVQGLGFSSTMTSQYDASRTDETWRCAFCKRGSHSEGLGDLFGPYFIQQEGNTIQQTEDVKSSKSKKKRRKSTDDPQKTSKKSKSGALKTEAVDAPGPWEIWIHEPCAVWAAGVHLVGARMVGLQEAVWGASASICDECGLYGANLGCVRRCCTKSVHYSCAKNLNWQLDEDGYISCCPDHKRVKRP